MAQRPIQPISNAKKRLKENGYKERRSTVPDMAASGNFLTNKGRVVVYPDNTYYVLKDDSGKEGRR